jgi:hypothetical protein
MAVTPYVSPNEIGKNRRRVGVNDGRDRDDLPVRGSQPIEHGVGVVREREFPRASAAL